MSVCLSVCLSTCLSACLHECTYRLNDLLLRESHVSLCHLVLVSEVNQHDSRVVRVQREADAISCKPAAKKSRVENHTARIKSCESCLVKGRGGWVGGITGRGERRTTGGGGDYWEGGEEDNGGRGGPRGEGGGGDREAIIVPLQ